MPFTPAWPMFFYAGKKPLVGARRTYQPGDAFEIQTRDYVRSLGPLCGFPDAATQSFSELTYCKTVNVRSRSNAEQVKTRGLDAKAAAALVEAA